MLKVTEISKTFNKGTINEKMALNKLSLTLEEGALGPCNIRTL